ncbi:MAG: DUF4330 domain-containing protein [Oscillospiraceae bacterium]|nr:DUF4330 domain-containing protein [Oscillospiraceae bacterium]
MKLVNERGKLFGIINLVDLVLLLVIILGGLAVGYKMLSKPIQQIVNANVPVTVTVRVRGAMPYLVSEMTENIKAGDRLVSGNSFDNAEVVSLEAVPYVYSSTTPAGMPIDITDPSKKDVIITIKSVGDPNAAIFKIGSQEVRTGSGFTFKTNRFEIGSIVQSVKFDG